MTSEASASARIAPLALDELGAPASSVANADWGNRPEGVMASAPRMSRESSVTILWYSLQYSLPMAASGPG